MTTSIKDLKVVTHYNYIYIKPDDVDSSQFLVIDGAVGLPEGVIGFPHNTKTYRELKALGLENVPHPMDNEHVFKPGGPFTPFEYQIETARFITGHYNSWILNSLGSGKTASCIWGAELLKNTKELSRVVVICPLSTVDRVWLKEIYTLYPTRSVGVLKGDKKKKISILNRRYDYLVVNHDSIRSDYVLKGLIDLNPDLIILDEATAMKNYSAKRFEALDEIVKTIGCRLWAITATPAPNSPEDIYAVQTLIDPTTVPSSRFGWRSMVMTNSWGHVWKPVPGHEEIVKRAMSPAIRFVRDDIPKLGKPVEYDVPLTPEQQKVFNAIKNEMVATVDNGEDSPQTILAVNAAVKINKLLQICSGNVYDINQDVVMLENTDRLNAIIEVLEEADARRSTKVIIFVPFKNAQLQIHRFLNDHDYPSVLVNGDVKQKDRTEAFRAFQEDVNPRVLIAHPKVASHGLTLTAASVVVWYGPHFSLELYEQGGGRVERIGQMVEDLTLVHIGSHQVEWDVYSVLMEKSVNQKTILDMYSRIINQ